jgi:trk system potassium uptake protein TrkH
VREKEYLKRHYAAIISSVGLILLLSSALMVSPLLILFIHPEESEHLLAFVFPAGCSAFLGIVLRRLYRSESNVTLSIQEGGIIVLISWITVIVFSAWPFVSILGLTFSSALFESMSGWTTTGLSVVDVLNASCMILLWRSITQLAGGAGLAIIMMSAIVGPTGMGISGAEGRGDQLLPHVRQSARLVLIIYSGYAAVGTLAYQMAGMSFFDAINHSFAAVSTGGFSTHTENIGYWDSPVIEAVSIPLMLIGNLSFVTAWSLLRGRLRLVKRNNEIRVMSVLIPLAATLVLIFTSLSIYPQLAKAIRVAVFETISALTTTGFQTVGYGNWNDFGLFILILLMLIGGGTCSTAGGVKQFRLYLLWKSLIWEVKRSFLPRTAVAEYSIWESNGRAFVDDSRIRQVCVFVFLYTMVYLAGVMVLCACGFSLKESLFEFASAIGNAGLSVGVTSARMPVVAMWAMTFAMFLGRLEFIVVIISILKLSGDLPRLMARTSYRS